MSDKKEASDSSDELSPRTSPSVQFSTSPTVFISFDDLMKASTSVANMTLAHEIAIDSDFKLQKFEPPNKSLEGQIKNTMMTAFWDILTSQINADPPEYTQALSLLKEVREEIKALLLPKQERIRKRIDEELDLELIKQQLEKNAFNLQTYADFIIEVMSKLCAPVRDSDIEELKLLKDPVELYKGIFRVIDLMKMDMANFTILQMRPYIQQQSVMYEKKKFQEFIEAQSKLNFDGLVATKAWLGNVYKTLTESNVGNLSPNIVLSKAYLELLDWDESRPFPECAAMDEIRLITMGEAIKKLLLVSTLILVAGSYYTVQIDVTSLKETIKSHCLAILANTRSKSFSEKAASLSEQIVADISQHATTHEVAFFNEKMSEMRNMLENAVSPTHRVHKLLKDRMWEFLSHTVLSDHRDPLQVPQGLNCVQNEIRQILGQLMRIMAHNRNVFGSYYDDILQSLMDK